MVMISERVRDALIDTISGLPTHLPRSLTWDQSSEMHRHHEFSPATDIPVYFRDPHSPWQRGSNENINGLPRQYFPQGTTLAVHSREHLDAVAVQLNGRPRKTLDWDTPAERLATLMTETNWSPVLQRPPNPPCRRAPFVVAAAHDKWRPSSPISSASPGTR